MHQKVVQVSQAAGEGESAGGSLIERTTQFRLSHKLGKRDDEEREEVKSTLPPGQ